MIELYCGKLGTGKSALAVRRAHQLWQTRKYDGIVTNMRTLRGPMVEQLTSIEALGDLRNRIVILDEVQSLLNSRNFKNTSPAALMVLALGRKLGHWMLATTQNPNRVDVVYRELVVEVSECFYRRMTPWGLVVGGEFSPNYDDEARKKDRSKFVRTVPKEVLGLYDTLELVSVGDGGGAGTLWVAPPGWSPFTTRRNVTQWRLWWPYAEFQRVLRDSGPEIAMAYAHAAEIWGPGRPLRARPQVVIRGRNQKVPWDRASFSRFVSSLE